DISYGGAKADGNEPRRASRSQWKEYNTGDGGNTVINPLNPSAVFTTYIFGNIFRYKNDATQFDKTIGTNSIFGEPTTGGRVGFIAPFTGNGVDQRLYFGTWRLFISTDLGDSWTAPAGNFDLTKGVSQTNGSCVWSCIAVGRAATNVISPGSARGRVMVSRDGGNNWSDITAGLPNRYIKTITPDPANSGIAYL